MFGSSISLSGSVKRLKSGAYFKLLQILDICVACIIVAPSVVIYWRGTWELLGYYIVLGNEIISAAILVVLGASGHVLMALSQDLLRNTVHPDSHRLTYYFISRLYTAIYAVICVAIWRGCWCLFDIWVDIQSLTNIIIITTVCVVILLVTRTVRSLSAAPFLLAVDVWDTYFEVETLFQQLNFKTPGRNMLDAMLSVVVIGTLVIVAWRGFWVISDLVIFPSNQFYSALVSLVIGYGSVVFLYIVRPLFQFAYRTVPQLFRLTVTELFSCICFIGTINVWRGIWIILDLFSPPQYFKFICWTSNIGAYAIMASLKCSNSLLVRGVLIDHTKEVNTSFGFFPVFLIQMHTDMERNRKIFQEVLTNENSDEQADSNEKQENESFVYQDGSAKFIAHSKSKSEILDKKDFIGLQKELVDFA